MGPAATRHTITLDQLNRHVAARQRLLPGHGGSGVLQTCRDIVALHSTEPTVPYISLWARIPGFTCGDLDHELFDQHSLLRIACMRTTVHLVPTDELGIFQQSCACIRQAEERRILANAAQELGQEALDDLRRDILGRLAEAGPATAQELAAALPGLRTPITYAEGKPYAGAYAVGSPLISALCTDGLVVRGKPRGTWRSSQYEYALLSTWAPEARPDMPEPREAVRQLAQRYLARFGPATVADLIWWSGVPAGAVRQALQDLGEDVVEVEVKGLAGPAVMLRQDETELREPATAGEPAVWLLPSLDPYVMGYRDRGRFLSAEHNRHVIDRAGNAIATAWAGSRIVGLWGQKLDGSVVYRLFAEVSADEREALDHRAAELSTFLGGEVIPPRTYTPFSRLLWEEYAGRGAARG